MIAKIKSRGLLMVILFATVCQLIICKADSNPLKRLDMTPKKVAVTQQWDITKENVALGKPAKQLGTWKPGYGPEKAVDGNTNQVLEGGSCAHPDSLDGSLNKTMRNKPAWWTVDLGNGNPTKRFFIENVTIYFRNCCPDSYWNSEILVGDDSNNTTQIHCARIEDVDLNVQSVNCPPDKPVRYLTVRSRRGETSLILCEVIVSGYPDEDQPILKSVSPAVGPISGGTYLTIEGYNLNQINGTIDEPRVCIDNLECPLRFRNKTLIVCTTPTVDAPSIDMEKNITIRFRQTGIVVDVKQDFTYKEDPKITKVEPIETIVSGGVQITVDGTGFDVVARHILQITIVYHGTPIHMLNSTCTLVNSRRILCPTPHLDIFDDDGNLDFTAIYLTRPPPGRRKRDAPKYQKGFVFKKTDPGNLIHRYRRQTDSSSIAEFKINNETLEFHIGFILDGVQEYRNLTENLPQYSKMTVYRSPTVQTWKEQQVVTFGRKMLEVEGERLLTGIQESDYKMSIGNSSCVTLTVYSQKIICTAPDSTPDPHPEDSSSGKIIVKVNIGMNEDHFVGHVIYKVSFFDNPKARWGIIGGSIGCLLLLVVILALLFHYIKSAQRKK